MLPIETSAAWAARKVAGLPGRWAGRLLGKWKRQSEAHAAGDLLAEVAAERRANIDLRTVTDRLATVAIPLDASDATICEAAERLAARASEVAGVYKTMPDVRAALGRIAEGQGVTPPANAPGKAKHVEDGPAVARMADYLWWRRQLRRVHGKGLEAAAIQFGTVNRRADPYCSNETVMRRAQQNDRNAQALEATIATNEDGDSYTLAELAAKGTGNKAIRRAELMTRIAGFERIADDLGHVGLFLTLTCPSRMHKWATVGAGRVIENRKYDGTTPNDAQRYLSKLWTRVRARLARLGIGIYGFRIAEPNHDGTPHWHMLFFMAAADVDGFVATLKRYALADSPDERGAAEHRVDVKPIDKGRGSAAGYIAKYVAKNIDGYRLDKDLIGHDAIQTSHRVEAWAATWGIRQFQQVGGPPVGPWRELRRVETVPANAPAHLVDAHAAVNKTKALDDLSDSQQQTVKGAQWDKYCNAQGGVFVGRKYRIKVEKVSPDTTNRYGEPGAPLPVGVSTLEQYQPEHMTPQRMGGAGLWATRRIVVDSKRHTWTISHGARGNSGTSAQRLAPWTCVNNCTGDARQPEAATGLFAAKKELENASNLAICEGQSDRTSPFRTSGHRASGQPRPHRRSGREI